MKAIKRGRAPAVYWIQPDPFSNEPTQFLWKMSSSWGPTGGYFSRWIRSRWLGKARSWRRRSFVSGPLRGQNYV